MLIDGKSADEIKSHLVDQFKTGHKWVVFNPYKENLKEDIHCFKEFSSAYNHCSNKWDNFKPISNVLRSLDGERFNHCKKIDQHVLSNEILRLRVEPFNNHEELKSGLANGELYPVLLKRNISPDEICNYKIYEHTHSGHQVNEIGHESDLVASFSIYKEANSFFEQHLNTVSAMPDRAKPDLTLIAEFKHQQPELDIERYPMYNSALLLKIAYPNYDSDQKRMVYDVKDCQDVNSLEIKQSVLAKFNTGNNQLELFNSNLEKVHPADKIPYMQLAHFSTSKVEIVIGQKQTINSLKNEKELSPKIKIS